MKVISCIGLILLVGHCSLAEFRETPKLFLEKRIEVDSASAHLIEVFKPHRVQRKWRFSEGRKVWVLVDVGFGKFRTRRAEIVSVFGNAVKFKFTDERLGTITYRDSEISYIGMTSGGRVIMASVANISIGAILTPFAAIVGVVFVVSVISNPTAYRDGSFFQLMFGENPFVSFRKNFDFRQYRAYPPGVKKFSLRIVQAGDIRIARELIQ